MLHICQLLQPHRIHRAVQILIGSDPVHVIVWNSVKKIEAAKIYHIVTYVDNIKAQNCLINFSLVKEVKQKLCIKNAFFHPKNALSNILYIVMYQTNLYTLPYVRCPTRTALQLSCNAEAT